ncbi:MAG: 1-acyl-sn-glycerol-3-phosphate acyltransferase [Bacilli bacterium]|nr:1-acyl-sn-glycerol-3-phosphate acyltransferase [Bacilli bacterium]
MYKNCCMYFDPKTTKYPYPEYTDGHYLDVVEKTHYVFDENYPYVDTSKKFRRKQFWIRVLLRTIVFPMAKIRFGLKVNGKKNLKTYKLELSQGVISVTNHIHSWDYIFLMRTVKPIKTNVLVWAPNVNGPDGSSVRLVGGIPIPENNLKATMVYYNAIDKLINQDHGWLQIYAEGSMWEYYAPIRPFKRGSSFFAIQFNKPIMPIAYSYRKPTWIRKKIFHQPARITINVGEPIYPDNNIVDKNERELDLTRRVHERICELAGIRPEDNIYPSIYDHSKRVDYYPRDNKDTCK